MGKDEIKIINKNIDNKTIDDIKNKKLLVSFYTLGCRKV